MSKKTVEEKKSVSAPVAQQGKKITDATETELKARKCDLYEWSDRINFEMKSIHDELQRRENSKRSQPGAAPELAAA
jgi:hypothetical protein